MKICFMGTPEFALPALQRLIDSPQHEVVLVVTQPDRPKGRGRTPVPPPVKELAEAHDIPVMQPARIRDELAPVVAAIRDSGARACVVAAFGQMLPDAVLETTEFGCLNIHPSLLPAYRGAAPVQRALMDGLEFTGVTIMKLVSEMDAGPVISQLRQDILPDDDSTSLLAICSVLGAEMLLRVLDEAEQNGRVEMQEQDHQAATYAPPLTKQEGLIDWSADTETLMARMRGLTPWPGAYTYLPTGKQLTILQGEPLWSNEAEELGDHADMARPGTVTSIKRGFGFTVRTGSGHLLVTRVQLEGKKPVDAVSFCNGRGTDVGQLLDGPQN